MVIISKFGWNQGQDHCKNCRPTNWIGQEWGNTIYWGRLNVQVHLGIFISLACILYVSQHIDNTDYGRYWQVICNFLNPKLQPHKWIFLDIKLYFKTLFCKYYDHLKFNFIINSLYYSYSPVELSNPSTSDLPFSLK